MPTKETKLAPITGVQAQQQLIVSEVQSTMSAVGCDLTPYGVKCAMNAIAGAVTFLSSKGKTLKDINATIFKLSVQNVAVLELNYGASPSEIYFDLRGDILTIKTQGAGNEKLVRKYGVGISKTSGIKQKPWLVREGDEFTLPSYNGIEITPPTWAPKSLSGKVMYVVYVIEKADGTHEYLMADREGIKPNIVAQIRQNALYGFTKKDKNGKIIYNRFGKPENDEEARDAFYEQLNKDAETMTVEQLIDCPKYQEYINPTYTSLGSKEAMIIRKMKNNALKEFPKEYDNAYVKDAVENIYEDKDDTVRKKYVGEVDATAKADAEVDATPLEENAPKDFQVNDDGEIVRPEEHEEEEEEEVEKPEPQPIPKAVEPEEPKKEETDCEYF